MFEIAGGIILAVLILWFLPQIIAAGLFAIGIVLLLAIGAAIIYFGYTEPGPTSALFGIAALVWGAVYIEGLDNPLARRIRRFGMIMAFGLYAILTTAIIISLLGGAVLLVIAVSKGALEIWTVAFGIPLIAIALWAVKMLRRSFREMFAGRQIENKATASAA